MKYLNNILTIALLLVAGLSTQGQTLTVKSNGSVFLIDVHDVTQITFPKEEGVRKMDVQFTNDTDWKPAVADVQIMNPDDTTPTPGAPIVVNTTDNLAYVLSSYMTNTAIAEGQAFYLKGGETYILPSSVSIFKGLTLQTDPADVAQGKRAKVIPASNVLTFFMLGRRADPNIPAALRLNIGAIRFVDIDFDCPDAKNYGDGTSTGNYFMNMYSDTMGFDLALLEWSGCTFQGIIRGFFRTQGPYEENIYSLRLTGCNFYNCGYYDANGRGYGYIHADNTQSKPKMNLLENVEISECVFYDSPWAYLLSDANRNVSFDASVRWNINVHHNTFVNFSTRGNNPILNTRYMPGGSVLGFHDNVVICTKAADDTNRNMGSAGWDARTIQGGDGSGTCTFNIYNNWTTNDSDKPFKANAFEATNYAPGKFKATSTFPAGVSELPLHVDTSLKATDLMKSPNPQNKIGASPSHLDHHTDTGIEGLYYQQTSAVKSSAIYTSGAGAQRLR